MTSGIREAFESARARVERMQRGSAPVDEIMGVHTRDLDEIVVGAFTTAMSNTGRDDAGIALVALGGYGRGELAPNSDLDLLLLYRGWSANEITHLNRDVMYPLWDSRRELGDRIREPRDVVPSFDRIDEVCALLDARLLAGDRGLFGEMLGTVGRRLERGRASFLSELRRASAERHRRYGHAGHLLEPNIRDSAGGLRDVHTLGWASKVLPGGDGIAGLLEAGHIGPMDAGLIGDARSFLLRLRIELHLLTARHQDQLYLAEQDELARRLSYQGSEARPAADRLMQELFAHARHVDAVVSSFWDRIHLQGRRRRRWRAPTSESVGDGCVVQDGRLEVVAVTNIASDLAGWLRVFRRSILSGAQVGRSSLSRLNEQVEAAPVAAWSPEAREIFLEILEAGTGGTRALEDMDLSGLLPRMLVGWEPIRAFPQRDLYHRYTVDHHLFAAVAELAASRTCDEADVRHAWSKVSDPDALFVAALLHDVGKGRPGDHSEVGARLATDAARRMVLDPHQVDDVAFLVREHLMLAETAVRRDLNEPKTIAEVAERVVDERRLAMLYLLTRADSLATGAEAWSSFRASLVRELYGRTLDHLAGAAPTAVTSASGSLAQISVALGLDTGEAAGLIGPMPESWVTGLDLEAAGRQLELLRTPLGPDEIRTSVHHAHDASEFVVVAADRPGLFSVVAGVLALRGFDVHGAEIYTRSDGVAIEVFRVISAHGSVPNERWTRLRSDIGDALSGQLDLDVALSKKSAQSRRRRAHRRREVRPRVIVDNTASATHTVVEVHTEDRLGLLRAITGTLAGLGCDLYLAKVATYGVEVVDVFYIHDLEGRKITDESAVAAMSQRLVAALTSEDG